MHALLVKITMSQTKKIIAHQNELLDTKHPFYESICLPQQKQDNKILRKPLDSYRPWRESLQTICASGNWGYFPQKHGGEKIQDFILWNSSYILCTAMYSWTCFFYATEWSSGLQMKCVQMKLWLFTYKMKPAFFCLNKVSHKWTVLSTHGQKFWPQNF